MLLTRDFQNSRNCLVVILQYVTQIVCYMLINKNNTNIITLGKLFQCGFHNLGFGVLFHCEEVTRVGCSVADSSEEKSGDGVLEVLWSGVNIEWRGR